MRRSHVPWENSVLLAWEWIGEGCSRFESAVGRLLESTTVGESDNCMSSRSGEPQKFEIDVPIAISRPRGRTHPTVRPKR